MVKYLQMDGVDDLLRTPVTTLTKVSVEFSYESNPTATTAYYLFDNRGGSPSGNYLGYISGGNTLQKGSAVTNLTLNGVTGTSFVVSPNTRYIATFEHATVTTDSNGLEFFVNYINQNTTRTKGNIYRITGYNGSTVVFDYDMSIGTVQDQSGNGNHATLTGGTWLDDGAGGTTPTTQDGTASLIGYGTISTTGNILKQGSANLIGTGTLSANGELVVGIHTIDGSAILLGTGQLTANADVTHIAVIVDGTFKAIGTGVLDAYGTAIRQKKSIPIGSIVLKGNINTTIHIKGSKNTTIHLKGGIR